MATELVVVEVPSAYERDETVTPIDPGFAAADVANGNEFRATGRELVLVRNTDSSTHNVTVTSQPVSRTGRTGDITDTVIPISPSMEAFQIFPRDGWETAGVIFISADNAFIEIAVLRLPLQAAG